MPVYRKYASTKITYHAKFSWYSNIITQKRKQKIKIPIFKISVQRENQKDVMFSVRIIFLLVEPVKLKEVA